MGIRNYFNTSKQDTAKNKRLLALAGRLQATPDTEDAAMDSTSCWLTKAGEGKFEIGRILHLKFETRNLKWTGQSAR
jgi:hypothetical protein